MPWRAALVGLAVSWLVAGLFLLLSWRSSVEAEQLRDAPICSTDQVFTPASCQITLNGRVVETTHDLVQLDVAGHRTTMPAMITGDLSGVGGTPVSVTFYRGEPIRVNGPALKADAKNSPADDAFNYRNVAIAIAFITTFLIGANTLIASLRKPRTRPGAESFAIPER